MASSTRSSLSDTARAVAAGPADAVAARVVELKGFSTWPGDPLVVVDDAGVQHGRLPGDDRVRTAAAELLARRDRRLGSLTISIDGPAVAEAGLACGGLAELVLQPVSTIPPLLWRRLAARAPVGLVTPLAAGDEVSSTVVLPDGTVPGAVPESAVASAATSADASAVPDAAVVSVATSADASAVPDAAVVEAASLLRSGQSGVRRLTEAGAEWLVEAWVPEPRLVVVGAGELVAALRAQAGLLGWEVADVDGRPAGAAVDPGAAGTSDDSGAAGASDDSGAAGASDDSGAAGASDDSGAAGASDDSGAAGAELGWPALSEALVWAGGSGALVVLSHDPHADVPAIGAALDAGVGYIGAMGSRRTQSRRMDRLAASGRSEAELATIRRPIGLDLGGRSAPQLALAICAEILAVHCGRDGRPLAQREGPIH